MINKLKPMLAALIDAQRAPFMRRWVPGMLGNSYNAITGRRYTGVNAIALDVGIVTMNRNDERWLSFGQGITINANMRKGEKGTEIIAPKFNRNGAGDDNSDLDFKIEFLFNAEQFNRPDRLAVQAAKIPASLSEAEFNELWMRVSAPLSESMLKPSIMTLGNEMAALYAAREMNVPFDPFPYPESEYESWTRALADKGGALQQIARFTEQSMQAIVSEYILRNAPSPPSAVPDSFVAAFQENGIPAPDAVPLSEAQDAQVWREQRTVLTTDVVLVPDYRVIVADAASDPNDVARAVAEAIDEGNQERSAFVELSDSVITVDGESRVASVVLDELANDAGAVATVILENPTIEEQATRYVELATNSSLVDVEEAESDEESEAESDEEFEAESNEEFEAAKGRTRIDSVGEKIGLAHADRNNRSGRGTGRSPKNDNSEVVEKPTVAQELLAKSLSLTLNNVGNAYYVRFLNPASPNRYVMLELPREQVANREELLAEVTKYAFIFKIVRLYVHNYSSVVAAVKTKNYYEVLPGLSAEYGVDKPKYDVYMDVYTKVWAQRQSLEARFKSFSESDIVRSNVHLREGVERRTNDADVTAEQFQAEFGLRAVEFGNWVTQAERQLLLNRAWDGFADLAEFMDMPRRAIGLGSLSVAFGSRGTRASSAYYSPSLGVISINRHSEEGALAHEWFHAADHFFGRHLTPLHSDEAKLERDFDADKRAPVGKDGASFFVHAELLSKTEKEKRVNYSWWNTKHQTEYQFYNAFIRSALNPGRREAPNMLKSSELLDAARRSRGQPLYWSSGAEMRARAFEAIVAARVKNTFLVSFGESYGALQPYPVGVELKAIQADWETFGPKMSAALIKFSKIELTASAEVAKANDPVVVEAAKAELAAEFETDAKIAVAADADDSVDAEAAEAVVVESVPVNEAEAVVVESVAVEAGEAEAVEAAEAVAVESVAVEAGESQVAKEEIRPRKKIRTGGIDFDGAENTGFRAWRELGKDNYSAINLVKTLDAQDRYATADEQSQLAKYSGFGHPELRRDIAMCGHANYGQRPVFLDDFSLLPKDERHAIEQSTQYAHYTDHPVIDELWRALARMGLPADAKVIDPGCGTGRFGQRAPADVRYTGVELEPFAAAIAAQLLQRQTIHHMDFIKFPAMTGHFDGAIGNVPFSNMVVYGDPNFNEKKLSLQEYFVAKTLNAVHEGGVVALIASRAILDSKTTRTRKFLHTQGDLIGAIRLPDNAFQDAQAAVVADILFFRRRTLDTTAEKELPSWIETQQKTVTSWGGSRPITLNNYFIENPAMVVGEHVYSGNVFQGNYGVKTETREEMLSKLSAAINLLPEKIYVSRDTHFVTAAPILAMDNQLQGVIYIDDAGEPYVIEDNERKPLPLKLTPTDKAWLRAYVSVRDAADVARYKQRIDAPDWAESLQALNVTYDAMVKKFGPVTGFRSRFVAGDDDGAPREIRTLLNGKFLKCDYKSSIVAGLEITSEDGTISKSPFFSSRSIERIVFKNPTNAIEALAVSLSERGLLDIDDIATRISASRESVIAELGELVFEEPVSNDWVLASKYLSGDVVTKYETALSFAERDPRFDRNVMAIKQVLPRPKNVSDVTVAIGASWVPGDVYASFISQYVSVNGYINTRPVERDPTGKWDVNGASVRSNRSAYLAFGTEDRSPFELFKSLLNRTPIRVMGIVDDKPVLDQEATNKAQIAASKITEAFDGWIFADSARTEKLLAIFNEKFNRFAEGRFDGDFLSFPGMSAHITPRSTQKSAVWRILQDGDCYLNHAVGAGKTFIMIAAGMEEKRLGLTKRPMFVVPKHMLMQFASEFQQFYPSANIMVADDHNFDKERRSKFAAAVQYNRPDAVIITHSAFEKIGLPASAGEFLRDRIIEIGIEQKEIKNDGSNRRRFSQLQQEIEKCERAIERMDAQKDNCLPFDEIGVDRLFVDEAHAFRKLSFDTQIKSKGIDPNGSMRALDMYLKTQWLKQENPKRSIVFASGTPVVNTLAELYTLQKWFAADRLRDMGMLEFDDWLGNFGSLHTELEVNAAGSFDNVSRISRFSNVSVMMAITREFMDVVTPSMLRSAVKIPTMQNGEPNLVIVPKTQALTEFMATLQARVARSKAWKPTKAVPHNRDPIIAIISDGRLAAQDPMFAHGQTLADETDKITAMAERIGAEYARTKSMQFLKKGTEAPDPVLGATQVVFYNIALGQAAMRDKLDRLLSKTFNVDSAHVAWFADADTDAKRHALQKQVREGHKRVVIGSAKQMGTGINFQDRISALHYFDPPWYPADIEQPHGRAFRFGNQNNEVRVYWYATENTYDATMWQMVGRKGAFIESAFAGNKDVNSIDDLSEVSQYQQVAAISLGEPRMVQRFDLSQKLEKLHREQNAHYSSISDLKSAVAQKRRERADLELREPLLKSLPGSVVASITKGFEQRPLAYSEALAEIIELEGRQVLDYARDVPGASSYKIVTSKGQHISLSYDARDRSISANALLVAEKGTTPIYLGVSRNLPKTVNGLEIRLNSMFFSSLRELENRARIGTLGREILSIEAGLSAPFAKLNQLRAVTEELRDLEAQLVKESNNVVSISQVNPDQVTTEAHWIAPYGVKAEDGIIYVTELAKLCEDFAIEVTEPEIAFKTLSISQDGYVSFSGAEVLGGRLYRAVLAHSNAQSSHDVGLDSEANGEQGNAPAKPKLSGYRMMN